MRTRLARLSSVMVLALVLATAAGCSALSSSGSESALSTGGTAAVAPDAQYGVDKAPAATGAGAASDKGSVAQADRLVVTTAAMSVRVDDLSAAIASVRTQTQAAGGSVSQLTVTDNSEAPATDAAGTNSATVRFVGPADASLTIRVPAQSLPAVQAKIAGLGKLVSQSSNESDVTQQHIDMKARLENLRAEEVRLRALLARAGKVSELLEVERELSRVRGEIESMAAQLAYLEGQAAMATLTVALNQPGPVVRPSSGGWGLLDAVTSGVQGAALLVRELVTAIIALSPILLIGAVIWWLLARRARKRRIARDALIAEQAGQAVDVATAQAAVTSAEPPARAVSGPEHRV